MANLKKEIAALDRLATDLQTIVGDAQELQREFLEDVGTTWEAARALDKAGRAKLQADYDRWLAIRMTSQLRPKAAPRRRRRSLEERTRPYTPAPSLDPNVMLANLRTYETSGTSLLTAGAAKFLHVGQHDGTYGLVQPKNHMGYPTLYAGKWRWRVVTRLRHAVAPQEADGVADTEAEAVAQMRLAMARHEEFLNRYPAHRYPLA